MKTSLTLIALSLAATLGHAKPADSMTARDATTATFEFVATGGGVELRYLPSKGLLTRAEVVAELASSPRLTGYVDGSEYEQLHEMFMSLKTRMQVRDEAVAVAQSAGSADMSIYGGGN